MAEINGEPILDNLQAHNGSVWKLTGGKLPPGTLPGLWVRRLFAPGYLCLLLVQKSMVREVLIGGRRNEQSHILQGITNTNRRNE